MDDGIGGNGAGASAAFIVKKAQDFAQGIGAGGVPEKSALAADGHEADVLEFFQVVRKRGRGDAEFVLDFAGVHSVGMSGEKEPDDLQARLGAKRGEAVGGTGDEKRVGLPHDSIIVEIQKNVKSYFAETVLGLQAS